MSFLWAIILLLLAIAGVVVRKTYFELPVRELKRRAEAQEPLAMRLYEAVGYGTSLRSFLWLYIGLTTAGSVIILARIMPVWVSLLIIGPVLWAVFSWLPKSGVTGFGAQLTAAVTPAIVKLLGYLHPVLHRTVGKAAEKRHVPTHTGIFEREDLIKLIEQQQGQADNRLTAEELEIATRALGFQDRQVGDILTSRKKLKSVAPTDTIGPVLIDEMHKSGQAVVLVREKPKGPVIGTLSFNALNIHSTGKVSDYMNPTVYYLHEEDSLVEALHAFFATNHPVFVVVNGFEEMVGVITIENLLQELLGHVPGEAFEHYANLEAVAARHTPPPEAEELPENESAETPVKTDEEVIELPSDENDK